MIGAPPPGGAPPGAAPKWTRPGEDPGDVWAMDYGKGRWIAPDEDKSSKRGHLAMPPGWSPRDLKEHPWSVVLSPPGTPPPPNTYTYTPSTREINAPGSAPSRDDRDALTLSFMPGGPPPGSPGAGTTTPPPGPAPGGQPGAGPPMPGRPGPGQPPGPGRPPGPPQGGMSGGNVPMPGSPPAGGGPAPGPGSGMGMPPPGGPLGPPGGSPPGMGGSPSPPMQPPGPLPPGGGGMPPRPPVPPPGMGPPMGAPAGLGAGVSPGPMPSGPGAAPPPAPPNPGMAAGPVRPPPPAPRPPPVPEHQDPDSMVAALLRALGFEGEAEPVAGEGQDRAPVGTGEDVPEDVTQARQRSVRAAADQWIGTPYRMGGSDQKAIDCSGLVNALLRGFGARIPAGHGPATTGWRNGEMATPIPWESIQPGDVLLSPANPRDPQNGEHMALYVGGGQMVEAAGPAGAPVRYSAVTNRNLQPYRMREAVPGLQQVTLMAQHEGGASSGGQQGASSGQPAAGPPSIQRIAMDALSANPLPSNAEIADIMAAGALFESGANPNGPAGDGGNSVGLWQINAAPNALGAGMTEQQRRDPATAAARIAPEYQRAYQQGQQRGFEGESLAAYTYVTAERPANDPANRDMRQATVTGPTAQAFLQKYREVDAHSRQQQELQIGGGYAPPSGAAGQQNAGGSPNLLQQAWAQAQPAIQQLMSTAQGVASAAGERVASLGATPAYAEPSPPAAGPPPGPTPQVQQPSPDRDQQARDAAAARETALAQGRQQEMDAGVAAAGTALNQPALSWRVGPQATPTAGPTAEEPAPAGAPPPTEYPGGFAAAASAAAGPSRPVIQPQQPPPTDIPRPSAAGAPASPAPTAAPAGLPPDTETQHWDNNILAWVPIKPPMDFGPGGGRYRLAPGVQAATDANGNPAPNPPGTPVEYVPIQGGYYDTPQGRMFFDSSTQQWHQPTGQAAAQERVQPVDLAPGLRFTPSAPNSRSGTVTWTDPNTGAISQAPYNMGDPMPPGLGQPSGALTPAQQASQQHSTDQLEVERQRLQESIRTANLSDDRDRQRIAMEMDQFNQRMAASQRSEDRQYTDLTAAQRAQTGIPTRVGGELYGTPPGGDPLAGAQDLGPVTPTPLESAQTRREQLSTTLPSVVGNRVYTPTTNPDTGEPSFQDSGPVPISSEQQALLDERSREFGTLSAYQQSQADQSKASLEEQKSEFSQSLAEKQAASARPYQQMTKAEQAQDARAQQELGLKKEQLGFQENESANKLEQLPRGGLTRVNPYTGQIELVNAPEPEDIRMVGSQIYIPGGRQVSLLGQQVSGGPNPYAGVPSGQGAPFRYPGGSGGSGGQSFGAGGWGGGGMGGGQSGGGYGWQQPRQQGWG